MEEEYNEILHVFAQSHWHSEAYVVGSSEALRKLRDLIDKALETKQPTKAGFMVNDGEGYDLFCMVLENGPGQDRLMMPYTDEIASDKDADSLKPWEIVLNAHK